MIGPRVVVVDFGVAGRRLRVGQSRAVEQLFDGRSRQHDECEDAQSGSDGRKKALQACNNQTEGEATMLLNSLPGHRDDDGHRKTANNEEGGEADDHPAEESGRRLSVVTKFLKRARNNRDPHRNV